MVSFCREQSKKKKLYDLCLYVGKNKLHDFVLRQLNSSLNTKTSTGEIPSFFPIFRFEFGDMMENRKKHAHQTMIFFSLSELQQESTGI